MKNIKFKSSIILLYFLLGCSSLIFSEQMAVDKSTLSPTTDTITHSEKQEDLKEEKTDAEVKEDEPKQIISNWKLYTIMLAFPVILIIIFVLVYIRGKR